MAENRFDAAMGACRNIEGDSERLTCYDQLAALIATAAKSSTDAVPAAAAVASAPTQVAPPKPEPQPLSDDVAKAEVAGSEAEEPAYTAIVTRCEDSARQDRKFFFMENDQVWKQSNAGRLTFEDKSCNFEVTIKRTTFGWTMEIPSEDRKIRVKRVR